MRQQLTSAKRWVVKVGSSSVTNNGLGLDFAAIAGWAEQLVALQSKGVQLVLVSSGAVAEGVARLGLSKRPTQVHMQQAAAAVGQMGLVQAYESCFQKHGIHSAQILLTHADLSDRTRYLNARSTLSTLLEMGVIPVVNENDTVATSELCVGDNDTLAALVANLINADVMILLTDQAGLFDADPRVNAAAKLIKVGSSNDPMLTKIAGGSSALGKGGMQTKVRAAKLAARSGTDTVIAEGKLSNVITRLSEGEELGTLLLADSEPVTARKQWLAGQLGVKGQLLVDEGAVRVLQNSGKSLLAAGIQRVQGDFIRGELVACVDSQGVEIARGLANYGSEEVNKILGHNSDQIERILGYGGEEEVIHRDNLVLP